ncbi:MAG: class I tRNA ligase family protein, partial [Agathobacter sp.]|nr:class I tRNA ligase family protein [Agathobacter sp.]
FSGYEQMGKAPFHTVLFHGLVRDSQGRKMSKSLGNGIDPLEIIDKYGADALRLTLITGNAPGNDMRFYWERVEASRNFANKVWNASRFIMMNLEGMEVTKPSLEELRPADKWILSKVNTLAKDATENMDKYELGIAVQKVYDFIWDEFCDWYIEIAKVRTYKKDEDPASANAALWTLKTVLTEALKLLHPYMPFITEEIFCTLQNEEETIMLSTWPTFKEEWNFPAEEAAIEHCKDLVKGVRNVRTEMDVPPSRKAKLIIVSEDAALRKDFEDNKEVYVNLAFTNGIDVQADKAGIDESAVSVVIPGATVYLPLEDLVDFAKEKERLTKEKEKLEKELARSKGMLSNERFLSNAKPEKVQEEKDKLAKYEQMMAQVEERLAQMP